jgi:hypothetical protein
MTPPKKSQPQNEKRKPKVLRFMSADEAKLFMKDKTLKNTTNHKQAGNRTDSVGCCFMVVDGRADDPDDGVYHSARYLAGVATTEYCLVGELKHARWRKGFGIYADHDNGDDNVGPIKRDELSTPKYSRRDFSHFKIYKPGPLEDHPMIALILMSSIPWRDAEVIYCSHLDRDCVR